MQQLVDYEHVDDPFGHEGGNEEAFGTAGAALDGGDEAVQPAGQLQRQEQHRPADEHIQLEGLVG